MKILAFLCIFMTLLPLSEQLWWKRPKPASTKDNLPEEIPTRNWTRGRTKPDSGSKTENQGAPENQGESEPESILEDKEKPEENQGTEGKPVENASKKLEPQSDADAGAFVEFDVSMPGYEPKKKDAYVCFKKKVPVSGYLSEIIPHASMDRVHHMIVYGCKTSSRKNYDDNVSGCLNEKAICSGAKRTRLLYAWARHSDPLKLPKGIGVPMGEVPDGFNWVAIQAHYFSPFDGNAFDFTGVKFRLSPMMPENFAGIYRLITFKNSVKANSLGDTINMRCSPSFQTSRSQKTAESLKIFAFRAHTHDLGILVSGYVGPKGETPRFIGKTNPQFPESFWPVEPEVVINHGDTFQGVCRYNSTGVMQRTPTGLKSSQEMCNLYIYYSYPANEHNPLGDTRGCFKAGQPQLYNYPQEGYEYVEPDPVLQSMGDRTTDQFGVMDDVMFPKTEIKFGEIGGLDYDDTRDLLVVFHRGSRTWSKGIKSKTPMTEATIVYLDPLTGSTVDSEHGKNLYYLPHGLTVDSQGKLWTTDVGSQTVSRYDPVTKSITKTLGEPFPNLLTKSENRFYRPAGVTVAKDGSVYVADGYENRRVVKYNADGEYEKEFSLAGKRRASSGLIHDIAIDEDRKLLYVADREYGNIQIVNLESELVEPAIEVGGQVYGLHYCKQGNLLFAVTYNPVRGRAANEAMKVIAFDMNTREKMFSFDGTAQVLKNPHTITSNPSCDTVYVGEIRNTAGKIIKFNIEHNKVPKEVVNPNEVEPESDKEVPM